MASTTPTAAAATNAAQALSSQPVLSSSIQRGADSLLVLFEHDKARAVAALRALFPAPTAPIYSPPHIAHGSSTSALRRVLDAADALVASQPSIEGTVHDPFAALREPLADARRELHAIHSPDVPDNTPSAPNTASNTHLSPPNTHPSAPDSDHAMDKLIMEHTRRTLAEVRVRQLEAELAELRSHLLKQKASQGGTVTDMSVDMGVMDVDIKKARDQEDAIRSILQSQ